MLRESYCKYSRLLQSACASLSYCRKFQPFTPTPQQFVVQRSMFRTVKHRITFQQIKGRKASFFQQSAVTQYVGDTEIGHTGLTGTEEITRPPDFQVCLGNPEPVAG